MRSPRLSRSLRGMLFVVIMGSLGPVGCRSDHLPGLPPGSPFAESGPSAASGLPLGSAVGDVTAGSALVWFHTAGPARVQVSWRPAESAGTPERSATVETGPEADFNATVPLHDLQPGTRYQFWVDAALVGDGARVSRAQTGGRFMTAPGPSDGRPVTFVWSADLGGQGRCRREPGGYAIFDRLRDVGPDFALLLGDLIYGDDRCPSPPNLPGSDFVAQTLTEYRAKHRYQRGDPSLRRFLAEVPVYATWDDHEVRNNFAGTDDPLMPVGRRALLDYWPIAAPPEDPYRLYRSFRWGRDLDVLVLDTRQYRSANALPDGPDKTMLGDAQRRWLLDSLARSTATWKLVATSVPLSNRKPGTPVKPGNDSWARAEDGTGFETELRGILDYIRQRGIRNVVWLVADVHYTQVNEYDPDGDGRPDFREFICGPLSAAPGKLKPPGPAFRPTTLFSESGFSNFGVVRVDGARLGLEIRDDTGRVRFSRTFAAERP